MTVGSVVHMTTAKAQRWRETYCGQRRLYLDTLAWGDLDVTQLLETSDLDVTQLFETSDVSQVTCPQCIDHLATAVEDTIAETLKTLEHG